MKKFITFLFLILSIIFLVSFTKEKIVRLAKSETNKGDFHKSINILLKSEDQSSEIQFLLAENYYYLNKVDSSIYYLTNLLSKSNVSPNIKAKSFSLLGTCYSNNQQYNLAISSIKKAIEIRRKNNDLIGVSKCYNNLGEVYYALNNSSKSLNYLLKANYTLKTIRDLNLQINLSNIGAAYIDLKQLNLALPYISKANDLAKELNDKLGESIAINNLATIYRDLKQQDSALYYYKKALEMVDELGSKEEKKTILLNLTELYEKKGNNRLALSYFKQYNKLKDELFNKEKNEFIVETQEKYQASERKKDLAEMKLKIQEKDAKQKQFIFMVSISVLIVLVLFVSIILWLRWKSIQQKNKAKLEIINATFYAEENQRLKISQEIHDDLGGILGVCRMLFTKSKQIFVDKNQDLFHRIDALLLQANSRSRAISHELFSPTLKQFGLFPAIEEYITNMLYLNPDLEINFQMQEFRVDEKLELNCFRITQELFTNTIKYANANAITLQIDKTNGHLNYSYHDNGIGFDFSKITKGVGLNSIQSRVKSFQGSLNFNTDKNFNLKISIPLNE
jgi:signal transduction histidine kinase